METKTGNRISLLVSGSILHIFAVFFYCTNHLCDVIFILRTDIRHPAQHIIRQIALIVNLDAADL